MDQVIEHKFSDNAIQMMEGRYLLEDENPMQMFRRVARGLANVENQYVNDTEMNEEEIEDLLDKYKQEFFDVMISGKFVPAGRTLTNVGIGSPVVPNCIVLPIEDTMDGIFRTLREAALLQQAGSGIGFNFSKLRPAMYDTKRSRGKASGPVSFLQTYNDAFARIQQQGRHGANMAMMHIDHPDILDFIHCKQTEGNIANFNISVLITDTFMGMLKDLPSHKWMCIWNDEPVKPRRITRDRVGIIQDIQEVDITVKELFDEIIQSAWNNGEPGVAFIDEINRTNPLPGLGDIDCSNPCGEQYLHAYDNCNLGSINLDKFVTEDKEIDYEELSKVTEIAVRMLDNVIDTFDIPIKEVQDMALANRRIGLGIMGFADMLYQLGIPYDSESALQRAEYIGETIHQASIIASVNLGKEKGKFLNVSHSINWFNEQRNAALTTIAPTGSISMLYDTSSGIEPNFALVYTKTVRTGDYVYVNQHFLKALKENILGSDDQAFILQYVKQYGTLQGLPKEYDALLSDEFKKVFVVANEISPEAHIDMQAKFQELIDNSISKTINMPEEATEEDVRKAFIRGWQMKCKSFTVYRNNSRKVQVLNISEEQEKAIEFNNKGWWSKEAVAMVTDPEEFLHDKIFPNDPDNLTKVISNNREKVKRPKVVDGKSYKIVTAHGNMYVDVHSWDGKVYEVFAKVGKDGGCVPAYIGAITLMTTLALRSGAKLSEVVRQLKDISCHVTWDEGVKIASPPDAIAWALAHHIPNEDLDEYTRRALDREKVKASGVAIAHLTAEQMTPKEGETTVSVPVKEMMQIISDVCENAECGSTDIVYQEGCKRCLTCGESKC